MADRKTPLTCTLLLAGLLCAPGVVTAASPDPATDGTTMAEPDADPVNRITMARFARAFGVLTRDTPPETLLEDPDASPSADALRKALSESGLERRDWDDLLKRMREDTDFRERVETLSASYRLGH